MSRVLVFISGYPMAPYKLSYYYYYYYYYYNNVVIIFSTSEAKALWHSTNVLLLLLLSLYTQLLAHRSALETKPQKCSNKQQ